MQLPLVSVLYSCDADGPMVPVKVDIAETVRVVRCVVELAFLVVLDELFDGDFVDFNDTTGVDCN